MHGTGQGARASTVDSCRARAARLADVVTHARPVRRRDRTLPRVEEGDWLAILDTGAYGLALASHYNTRPHPAEVLVDGKSAKVIRRRETPKDLMRGE